MKFTPVDGQVVDTRQLSQEAREIYGNPDAPILLRIGNGGAGPTGILGALARRFLADTGLDGRIDWYQDISRYTLEQLRLGVIDLALVYEYDQAQAALVDGYAEGGMTVFYDQFLIAGPKENPARLHIDDDIDEAMLKIALLGDAYPNDSIFISRDDQSATNIRERALWERIGRHPWEGAAWYEAYHAFPEPALLRADAGNAYILSDQGTWLTSKDKLKNTKVYTTSGTDLLNPCMALVGRQCPVIVGEFLAFLCGESGQAVIRSYGVDTHGQAIFKAAKTAIH